MASAFIGRAAELRRLADLLATVREKGRPATVLIGGEAGVGKSELLTLFCEQAAAEGAQVLSGACIELGSGAIPYGPLIEALRRLVRERTEEKARELAGPAWSELAPLISDFTGAEAPVGGQGSQLSVFGAVSRLLDHIGRTTPLVLVFEDVHWADPSTLDLIAYLTRMGSDERLLLICTHRSDLERGHPVRRVLAAPQFSRGMHRISLSRFTTAEMRDLITALATEPAGPEQVARCAELADGNPYFASQLVAAGYLADPDRLPETVADMMAVRLEQLSPAAAKVVEVAAVAGRRVGDRLLGAVSELDAETLADALQECLDQLVLVEDRTERGYAFQHALLRAAAYERIADLRRRLRHEAVARALAAEAEKHSRLVPELAYHWFAAAQEPEALAWAVRAGDLAVRMRAFQEAETQYRRALELWPGVPGAAAVAGTAKLRVLTVAADAARWAGHVDQAVRWAREAIDEAAEADGDRLGELYERLGSYLWEARAVDESAEAYRAAEQHLAGGPPSAAGSRVQAALATVAVRDGQHVDGLARAKRAGELARAVRARAEEGRALNSEGLALTMLDEPDEGVRALRQGLEIAIEVDHLEDTLRAYANLGLCLEHADLLAESVEVLLDGLAKARGLGLLHTRQGGVLANNASATLTLLGRWDEAVALLDEARPEPPATETAYQLLNRAEIATARGRFDEAEGLLREVRSRPNTDARFVGPLYGCLAELALWRHDGGQAAEAVTRGLEAIAGSENVLVRLQLYAMGLRVAADGHLSRTGPQEQRPTLADVAALLDAARQTVAGHPGSPGTRLLLEQCEAEHARAASVDAAAAWRRVADGWESLERPYPMAYARFREAEAEAVARHRRATVAAGGAFAAAERLGAEPLREQIAALASRYRLDLVKPLPAPRPPLGLTDREFAVLRGIRTGRTNREIGQTLYISESTVSVHVTNLMRKLGVRNRAEAATVALREGFFAGD
ncbi:helix-turn-helix transcriptional regulator [Catellatospora sp. IY07-71]|uniref:helix-turn-helix transcriptional regulator n=1 Tax=Catellatospora sp. IY07-71 TaxID=2728827 RepID=UPI001BB40F44|nr:helix-turn-helix transcriptional regulator [Catellatospora sp. IY07-71]